MKLFKKKVKINKLSLCCLYNYFTNVGQSIAQCINYKGSKKYNYYLNTLFKYKRNFSIYFFKMLMTKLLGKL